jgi:hypothetical protein
VQRRSDPELPVFWIFGNYPNFGLLFDFIWAAQELFITSDQSF